MTGATVHFVNEIPDGGEIIMQKAVKVRDGDTPETLQKKSCGSPNGRFSRRQPKKYRTK